MSRKPRITKADREWAARVVKSPFNYSENEWARISCWQRTHECSRRTEDGRQYFGAVGGGYTYTFIPTSIGMISKVRCACGAELNTSDAEFRGKDE